MNDGFKKNLQRLDTAALVERAEKADRVRKEHAEATHKMYERAGWKPSPNDALLERAARDPLLAYWLLKNRDPQSC
jgi:hypothetical protein